MAPRNRAAKATSHPPYYACFGGPLDNQCMKNYGALTETFHDTEAGRYRLRKHVQGTDLHVYEWEAS